MKKQKQNKNKTKNKRKMSIYVSFNLFVPKFLAVFQKLVKWYANAVLQTNDFGTCLFYINKYMLKVLHQIKKQNELCVA